MAEISVQDLHRSINRSLRWSWMMMIAALLGLLAVGYLSLSLRLGEVIHSTGLVFEANLRTLAARMEDDRLEGGTDGVGARLTIGADGVLTRAEPAFLMGLDVSHSGLFERARTLRDGEEVVLYDLDLADMMRRAWLVTRRGDRIEATTFDAASAFLPTPPDLTLSLLDDLRIVRFSSDVGKIGDVMGRSPLALDGWRVLTLRERPLAQSDALSLLVVKDVSGAFYGTLLLLAATALLMRLTSRRLSHLGRGLDRLEGEFAALVDVARDMSGLPHPSARANPEVELSCRPDVAAALLQRCEQKIAALAPRFRENRVIVSMMANFCANARSLFQRVEADARILRESEARFRALADSAPALIWRSDRDGRFIYVNRRWPNFTGRTMREELGDGWLGAVDPEDRPALVAALDAAHSEGLRMETEFRLRRRDGAYRWMWIGAQPCHGDSPDGPGFAGMCVDVTVRRDAEAALERAREAAQAASQSKTRFLAAASHDLRQPVQAITLFVHLLAMRNHDPDLDDLIRRANDSLGAFHTLLNALLDVSKLDAGLIRAEPTDAPLAPILERLRSELTPLAREKGLDLRIVASTGAVRTDPVLAERILRNLLVNAIRYTRRGRILMGCRRCGDRLRVEVHDTGVGIPADQLDLIFQEFHQVDNPERDRAQGLGLGLSIVRRLATMLDHPVTVASHRGRGSCFAVSIPLAARPSPARRPLAAASPAEAGTTVADGGGRAARRVVMIDDDPLVREALTHVLGAWGLRVLPAASIGEAESRVAASDRAPELIISDYRLAGGETGEIAIRRVRAAVGRPVPAVLLTGDTSPERLAAAAAVNATLLHKPVNPDDLRRVVDESFSAAHTA